MDYVCKVGTPTGEVVEQTFTATDESALRTELEQKGYYLFSVRRGFGLRQFGLRKTTISTDRLLIFCQELAALLKAGLPLVQSLEVMLERQPDPVFKRSLEIVRDKLKSGIALSDAFRAEGDLYPPILSASLIAGERSGNLEGVLRRLVQYLRLTSALRKKAIAAAVYPILLLVVMTAMMAVMLLLVIPQFQDFYRRFRPRAAPPHAVHDGRRRRPQGAPVLGTPRAGLGLGGLQALGAPRGLEDHPRPPAPLPALRGRHDAKVFDQPARPHAVRPAPGRPSPPERPRGRRGLDRE